MTRWEATAAALRADLRRLGQDEARLVRDLWRLLWKRHRVAPIPTGMTITVK